MRFLRFAKILLALVIIVAIGLALHAFGRSRPQDVPWTPLDLGRPIGLFTGAGLNDLTEDAPRCRALLDAAGVRYTRLPPRDGPGGCGYADGVGLRDGGSRAITYAPTPLGASCAVAAALAVWEWEVVQPAAVRHFGRPVSRIDHFGTYSCRPVAGRRDGRLSEHATADAIDIAGFRLDDGARITVAADWTRDGPKAAFLRDVRDGACRLFATTLSPDYNAAHADHLHMDQARRGGMRFGGYCPGGDRSEHAR